MEKRDFTEKKRQMNSRDKSVRMAAIKAVNDFELGKKEKSGITNNHVHSTYSFSPYTPTRIVYEAYRNNLDIVGIMDHDAIGGAEEFIAAGKAFGIATTVGFEIRTDWSDTPFWDKRINNPDQMGCAYMCVHGVPHQNIGRIAEFLTDIVSARNERNQKMVARINDLIPGIGLSFENDVVPISMLSDGGTRAFQHEIDHLDGILFIDKAIETQKESI